MVGFLVTVDFLIIIFDTAFMYKKLYVVKDFNNKPVYVAISKAYANAHIKWFLRSSDYFVDFCLFDESKFEKTKDTSAFVGL